jgi:hypothetical protein
MVLLIVLLNERPDRIECVSDAAESLVSRVERCDSLKGAGCIGGVNSCAAGTGVVGKDVDDRAAPVMGGNSGGEGFGIIIVFLSLRPRRVGFLRGMGCC